MEMDGEAMDIDSSAAQNQQATKTTSNSDSNGVGTKKGTRLVIANAHLHWDPMFQDVKLWQMHRVLLHVRALRDRHAKPRPEGQAVQVPVLLCGEMTSI